MASSSYSSLSILSPWRFRSHKKPFQIEEDHYFILSHLSFAVPSRFPPALRASRRYPNNNNYSHKEAVVVVPDPRAWVGDFGADEDGSGVDDDDNEEDEEDDRSLDLLARFLQNMFKKISRQARKSVRSVLPSSISTKLVRFSVNGVLILAFLWILKALLELLIAAATVPDDEACLTNLRSSLEDPANSLRNWTKSTFASPCNGFTSYLEGATCNNGRIYKLSLPGRSLRGSISPFLSNCTNLQTLDLSSNFLRGPMPAELSSLLNLAVLNLSANTLSGQIPPQVALCAYLNVIDLHSNELSGPIPDQLGLLVRLSTFDVSYNRLEGPIPVLLANRTGAAAGMPRFNASSFIGNKDLYGYPLPPMRGRGLSVLSIVGIGIGSGMLSLILSFTAVCIWLRATDQNAAAGGGIMNGDDGKISHIMPDY